MSKGKEFFKLGLNKETVRYARKLDKRVYELLKENIKLRSELYEARRETFKNVLKLVSGIGERYCKEHDKHPESVLLNQSIVVINVIKEKIKELERKFKP